MIIKPAYNKGSYNPTQISQFRDLEKSKFSPAPDRDPQLNTAPNDRSPMPIQVSVLPSYHTEHQYP